MRKIRLIPVVLLVALGLMIPINMAFAAGPAAVQGQPAKELTAEWWQWAYSIPQTVNPVLDQTGENCVVGQRGDVWFLAGTFFSSDPVIRNCLVPEGKALYFPVVNVSFFNSPDACGQGPESYSVKEMRAAVAAYIDGATNLSVTLDGQPVKNIRRVRSEVFEVSLPEDNVFDAFVPCAAGVYSPTVDDGFYANINPLKPGGPYTLHIQADGFVDVTYHLTVVPVILK